jgi:Spo0E like sporulation regulatory protein.
MKSQSNSRKLSELQKQITLCRHRMQELWDTKGYTDPEILAASIELDELLNQYHFLQSQEL